MAEFEELLEPVKGALERFVFFRLPSRADAEDVLQEVYETAFQKLSQLQNPESFKPWILSIARNRCNDYFRRRGKRREEPLEAAEHLSMGRWGKQKASLVEETLERLQEKEKQMLTLYYFLDLPQEEIAKRLRLPLGTVKSRLHYAKKAFRQNYPHVLLEGDGRMKKSIEHMPEYMPEYTITPLEKAPFPVVWKEVMGWFLIPEAGEKLDWAMYDFPQRKRTECFHMEVTGRARVHGIEGMECSAREWNTADAEHQNADTQRTFVVQLTDTHCRILSESHMEDGVKKYYTFLDGDSFLKNWGVGKDNCGNETHLSPKGMLLRKGSEITCLSKEETLDVAGRYLVSIGGKTYDTLCVMDVECYEEGMASEQYLDEKGRTVLWRRFNRDDWAISRYQIPWTQKLPDNERITINGVPYVHWYDCITDYIL